MGPKRKVELIDSDEDKATPSDNDGSDNDGSDNDGGSDNDDEDEEADEEEVEEPPAKKSKTSAGKKEAAPKKLTAKEKAKQADEAKKKAAAAKKKKASSSSSAAGSTDDAKERKPKVLSKFERLEEARKAYKWWEAPTLANGINWESLEHAGVNFPPVYEQHGVPLVYDGEDIRLNREEEEVVSFFAAIPKDGPQLGNPKTKEVFQKNFFDDLREVLSDANKTKIKQFKLCNFDKICAHLNQEKELRKSATSTEKDKKKKEKDVVMQRYGFALLDGRIEKLGNYTMEPPGLFRGRGEHPKTGKLKTRTLAESVKLNLGDAVAVPRCDLPGHAWKEIKHDPAVTWLASWNENVQEQVKYVMLSASSSFKGQSDVEKYTKAQKLKKCIDMVRKDYTKKIEHPKDREEQELGVAMWVIDKLALRVGGEKGEEEADTVGCCSLRREHLTFGIDTEEADTKPFEIELEFLGKDSMLYKQSIDFSKYGDLGKAVYKCLRTFCKKKTPEQEVFENLTPTILNKHLTTLMPGLSAKVFRTFNASITLEAELPSQEDLEGLSVAEKVVKYNAANRQVAILCNHQKTVSKSAEAQFESLAEKLNTLTSQRAELIRWKEILTEGKGKKSSKKEDKTDKKDSKKDVKEGAIPLRSSADEKDSSDGVKVALEKALKLKEAATTTEERLTAVKMIEAAKANVKAYQQKAFLEKHKFASTPTVEALDTRIETWSESIRKMTIDIQNKEDNKEVALGTSKINYMDPRISVAWCKRSEVPIDKCSWLQLFNSTSTFITGHFYHYNTQIFAKTLRDKFNWAMPTPPNWKF